jgi:hypothetical protein
LQPSLLSVVSSQMNKFSLKSFSFKVHSKSLKCHGSSRCHSRQVQPPERNDCARAMASQFPLNSIECTLPTNLSLLEPSPTLYSQFLSTRDISLISIVTNPAQNLMIPSSKAITMLSILEAPSHSHQQEYITISRMRLELKSKYGVLLAIFVHHAPWPVWESNSALRILRCRPSTINADPHHGLAKVSYRYLPAEWRSLSPINS